MSEIDLRELLLEIRDQLSRNGLDTEFITGFAADSQPDIEAIRMTVEREEKIYHQLAI